MTTTIQTSLDMAVMRVRDNFENARRGLEACQIVVHNFYHVISLEFRWLPRKLMQGQMITKMSASESIQLNKNACKNV